ncbi:hypothetical protein LWI29_001660 [Acer saccharum]|uniref:Uncharacterized protein n=1 Tax=Acer saccharum TaxID=4024 RepID=A0AA39RSZ3_ACESA|nr:hypothetical protein LWI29_001660 [Acer saccharum]
MNEVMVISQLQHRNLVRLLGCCVDGEEKMLIYEYMPNTSLDVFLFDPLKRELLDWRKRFNIIEGISRGFYHDEQSSSLLRYAWKLWNENNIFALIDPVISDPSFHSEILRCIQMGLLCVQEFVKDRPTMPSVISMLNIEIVDLPTPKQPAFTERQNALDTESSEQIQKNRSVNYVTISVIGGR